MTEKRRIFKEEFIRILHTLPDISSEERAYLVTFFGQELISGLTEWTLNQKIATLKFNTKDMIDSAEAEHVKQAVLRAMGL